MVFAQTCVLTAVTLWFVFCVTSIFLGMFAATVTLLCSSRSTLAAQKRCRPLPDTIFGMATRIMLYGSLGVVAILMLVAIYLLSV